MSELIETLMRHESPRLFAALSSRVNDLSLVEDAVAEAFARALSWGDEVPQNPVAWLYRVALNDIIDQARKQGRMLHDDDLLKSFPSNEQASEVSALADEQLAMFFLCAHPAISPDSQAMLMLKFCAGLSMADIARWFSVEVDAVTRRLHRAKQKIQAAKIPYALPERNTWPERLPPVLSAIEILYDQSYSDIGGGLQQDAFARDAEQLALNLVSHLQDAPEALGLAAMILLAESRRAARVDDDGVMVALDKQDVTRWDQRRIDIAAHLIWRASCSQALGPYQIRAQIFAQHGRRAVLGVTPWQELLQLYDALLNYDDSASVKINRALVLAKLQGADKAMVALNTLPKNLDMQALHLAYAALHADKQEWRQALQRLELAKNYPVGKAEAKYLEKMRQQYSAASR